MSYDPHAVSRLVHRDQPVTLGVFGPTVQPLTVADPDDRTAPGILRGVVPPGHVIPLHAHVDPETFYVLSGELQALSVEESGPRWTPVTAGQILHVPSNARHAWRNTGTEPAVALIVTTPQMVGFFDAVGVSVEDVDPASPPSPQMLERMVVESAARGYWNASPEQNAAVGIELPATPVG